MDDNRAMAPPDPRELLVTDPRIRRLLLGFARKKTRSAERALELTQEAITRVLEGRGWYRWDHKKELLRHLADVVESLVANETRRASVWREQPMEKRDERKPDSAPSPEQQIDAAQQLQREERLATQVRQRVADDPIIPGMLEHAKAGIRKASELAALLRCSVQDIYRARERLAHHRDQVLEEERKQEQKRMKGRAFRHDFP